MRKLYTFSYIHKNYYLLYLIHTAGHPARRPSPGKTGSYTSRCPLIDKPETCRTIHLQIQPENTGTNNGKKRKHAIMGISWPDEYRDQKRRPDTVQVQLCIYAVLHPPVILSGRLVVAGHDDPYYPVVLAVITVGRQTLDMELTDTVTGRQIQSA